MKKKRLIIAALIILGLYIVFCTITLLLFNAIRNNPIDREAVEYIYDNEELCNRIQEEYGEIIHIFRYIGYKTIKDETTMKQSYSIDTKTHDIRVYVVFEKRNDEWKAVSYEVLKVVRNNNGQ